jgi:hypothetical protein
MEININKRKGIMTGKKKALRDNSGSLKGNFLTEYSGFQK